MGSRRGVLERIATALERLAPPIDPQIDWLTHPAYLWDGRNAQPVERLDALPLNMLRGIDEQKAALSKNLDRLANGAAAHDVLLWGARGMGKSALVRSIAHAVQLEHSGKLGLIQVSAHAMPSVAALIVQLTGLQRSFLLFIDDLGFGSEDTQANLALRSLLDGSVIARPPNVRLAVTSNRRAIVARDPDENTPLHERDERDNSLALADRFGLTLGFHPCDQGTYLEILRSYTDPLGLDVNEAEALAWAIDRGNRSGRTAYQFACELAGRAGKPL